MHISIGHLQQEGLIFYANDIVRYSKKFKKLLKVLDYALSLLSDGFVVVARKCHFSKASLEVLGQIVDVKDIKISSKKVEAIQSLPIPKTKKAL